ncbi:MAG: hypothetical protein RL001_2717 [Pseudomonadota bacterium]|jgi:hypothetical protein
MKKNSQHSLIRIGLSLLFFLAAQVSPSQAAEIKLQRQGEYTFITGGLSEDEVAFLEAQAPKYPIQLTFRKGGQTDGMKDFTVRVRDVRGEVVVETVAKGPYLYVNPPASGRFTIEAEWGQEKLSMTKDLVGRRYLHLAFEFGRDAK